METKKFFGFFCLRIDSVKSFSWVVTKESTLGFELGLQSKKGVLNHNLKNENQNFK